MLVWICDNQQKWAASVEKQLALLSAKHNVDISSRRFSSTEALLYEIEDYIDEVDLIYMDIHMPGLNGMLAARELRKLKVRAAIVFFTENEDYVYQAFDVEALHYILKGKTTSGKFEEVFLRAKDRYEQKNNVEVLLLQCAGEQRRIPIRDIHYFSILKRIVTVHYGYRGQDTFEFYSTLGKIEESLDAKGFVRTHKSFIVAAKEIKSVTSSAVTLRSGEVLPCGRSFYSQYMKKT